MIHVANFGAIPNGRIVLDGAIGAGRKEIWSADAYFTPTDVGKIIAIEGAGEYGHPLISYIESVNGAGDVATVQQAATYTVATKPCAFGKDNTTTIQSGLNDAQGDTLVFERGMYLHKALNGANRKAMVLQGSGPAYHGTQLVPLVQGWPALDFSGTPALQLRGLWIGDRWNPCAPCIAILRAPTTQVPGLDFDHHSDVMVTGRYTISAWYNFGAGSGQMDRCAFWNFFSGPDAERYAAVFSLDNSFGVASSFVPLLATGSCNLWTLNGCEFHEASGQSNMQFASILFRGASDYVLNGGIVSGSNKLIACKNPGDNPPRRIHCTGIRFESEHGTPQPTNILNLYGDVEDSHFRGCMQGQSGAFASGPGAMVNCSIN